MRWFDDPPAAPLDVAAETPGRLELVGPSSRARLGDGAQAAFGGLFASFALPFLRLPIPGPFRLIPLGFVAVGAGVAALGTSKALASCSVRATRAEGLEVRWRLPGLSERVRRVPVAELRALEVKAHHFTHESEFGANTTTTTWELLAVTRGGQALALETFSTKAQAELRKEALERVLRPATPEPAPKPPPARPRRPRAPKK